MYSLKKLKPVKGYVLKTTVKFDCDCCKLENTRVAKQIYLTEKDRSIALDKAIKDNLSACSFNYKLSCKIMYYE